MSRYTVEIKYTSNTDNAAKVVVKDDDNNVLLKSHAVLPKRLHEQENNFMFNLKLNRFIPEDFSSSNRYVDLRTISEYSRVMGHSYFSSSKSMETILKKNDFYSNGGKKAKGIDEAITLAPDAFDLLENILSQPYNNVDFVANQKFFLFGQKPCERTYDANFNGYKRLGKDISAEEENLKEQAKIREEEERALKKAASSKQQAESGIKKPATNFVPPKKTDVSKTKQSYFDPSAETAQNRRNYRSGTTSSNQYNRNYYDDDGLDAFDIMYMTAFPDMAPFFKPTSGLAWMMYFSHMNNDHDLTRDPVGCINRISGFEDVKGCDLDINIKLNNNSKSYNIDLYGDEEKTQYLGTAQYSEDKGLTIKDNEGNATFVSEMKDKTGYTVLVEGENSSKALVEVVQNKNNELIGNWTVEPHDSIMATSSFKVGEDFSMTSNPNQTLNLDGIQTNNEFKVDNFFKNESTPSMDVSSSPTPSFEPTPNIDNDNKYECDRNYEPPPPPPPPPPPEDSFNFTSSDPYSRTGPSM